MLMFILPTMIVLASSGQDPLDQVGIGGALDQALVQGVTVTHPRGLQKQLAVPGGLTAVAIEAIAQQLHAVFQQA